MSCSWIEIRLIVRGLAEAGRGAPPRAPAARPADGCAGLRPGRVSPAWRRRASLAAMRYSVFTRRSVGASRPPTPGIAFIDADDPLRHARQLADGAAFVELSSPLRASRASTRSPAASGRRAAPLRRHQDLRRRRIVAPVERARHHLAVDVDAGDLHHRRLRQGRRSRQPAAAPALDLALRGDLLQHRLQRDAVAAGDAEGARDLPLADGRRALADELENLLLRRQRRLLLPALAHRAQIRSILSGHNPRAALSAAS